MPEDAVEEDRVSDSAWLPRLGSAFWAALKDRERVALDFLRGLVKGAVEKDGPNVCAVRPPCSEAKIGSSRSGDWPWKSWAWTQWPAMICGEL